MRADQLIQYVIYPTLKTLNLYSPNALALMVYTSNTETNLAMYLGQTAFNITLPAILTKNSPPLEGGIGLNQMEHNTHEDIYQNYINFRPALLSLMHDTFGSGDQCFSGRMLCDLNYATAMTRIDYLRVKEPLPDWKNISAIADYHKTYYNSSQGKTDPSAAMDSYSRNCSAVVEAFIAKYSN